MDVLLYDGACPMCRGAAAALVRALPPGAVDARSFREAGRSGSYPGLDEAELGRAVALVRHDGRVFRGAEAVVQALRAHPVGWLARAYYIPGLRWACDRAYAAVARRRGLDVDRNAVTRP